jgi:hypothetical protein
MKLYKIASIAFIVLGVLHTIAHIVGQLNLDEASLVVLNNMANHKIQLLGEHSLLKFHTGFSLMMGFLLSVFGIQNLLVTKTLNKKYLISTIIITGIALILSIAYFHILATSFIFTSLICYILSYKKL